jgi:hypothetical protein
MDLFRPFLAQADLLATFTTDPRHPETIFRSSLKHIADLTRDYYTRFLGKPEGYTVSWVHGPLYVVPAMLQYGLPAGQKADVVYYIETCSGLLQSHRAMDSMIKALLHLAVSAEAISSAEANALFNSMKAKRKQPSSDQTAEAGWVIDHALALDDRTAATGDVIAQRFDEMMFMQEMVHSDKLY